MSGAPHAMAAGYALRLGAELQRLINASARPRALRVLIPPGSESTAGVAAFLALLAQERTLLDCRRLPVSGLLERIGAMPLERCALLFPEALNAGVLQELLAASGPRAGVLCVGERPFWLNGGTRLADQYLLDFRAFLYTDAELQLLLEQSDLGPLAAAGDSRAPTRHGLRKLAQAWPGMTEAALSDVACAVAAGGTDDGDAVEGIARLPASRGFFAAAWLPLLAANYPWLRHACRLPLITLDLLAALLKDIGTGAQQCLLMGWMERVPGAAGAYRLESVLEQFLLAEAATASDHRFLEKAAAWYEAHGHAAEAIECWAVVGLAGDRAAALPRPGPARMPSRGSGALSAGPTLQQGLLQAASASGAARQAVGSHARLDALPAARQPVSAAMPETPALQHVLKAISFYQSRADEDVTRALDAAVRAGIQPRQISNLIDFVDLHLRPLFKPAAAAGPLASIFGGLKHAGPARQSLRPASQALNHRELQILELICDGKGNKDIASRMGLELSTVKWYGTRIYEKLGVRSRTQAIAKARGQGLFD